jgi:hypothetical protein
LCGTAGFHDFACRREKIIPRIVVWEKLQEKKVRRSNAPTVSSSMVLFYLFWFLPANPFSDRFGLNPQHGFFSVSQKPGSSAMAVQQLV